MSYSCQNSFFYSTSKNIYLYYRNYYIKENKIKKGYTRAYLRQYMYIKTDFFFFLQKQIFDKT